jgi:hypothetical protein
MPTVNEVLGGLLQKAVQNPKSTIQSFLTVFLTSVPLLLASGSIHGKAAAIAASLLSVAKIFLGMLQLDGPASSTSSKATGTTAGIALVLVLTGMLTLTGCLHQVVTSTPAAALPAGAVDKVDADVNTILQPAHAFAADITAAVLSTDPQVHIELTAAQKTVLAKLNQVLNIADPLEQAYHALPTAASAAQLKSAAADVSTAFTAARTALPPTGK